MLAPKHLTAGPQRQAPAGRHVMVLDRPPGLTGSFRRRSTVVVRRRMVLTWLLAATAATGLAALVAGGVLWTLFLAALAALGGYVALLVRMRERQSQAARKIRRLPSRPVPSSPVSHEYVGEARAVGDGVPPSGAVRVRSWNG